MTVSLSYAYLSIAIVAEVIATSALGASANFSRLWPSVVTVAGYATAFWFLSLALRGMSIGVAYAIWSGVGIVLISLVGWLLFKQRLDVPAIVGIGLIIAGVVVINVFSRSVAH
ncbi:SMR family transporter [Cupriavidus respiraculi]|uniref:Multidrug transporter EmrE n=1 Tax=Cupriavidus respiraculi TaxID=195930 RepID=A0ABN7YLM1_9BURK|nr:Multidrug transporter EmrE [Cupriavidus respiraculi]